MVRAIFKSKGRTFWLEKRQPCRFDVQDKRSHRPSLWALALLLLESQATTLLHGGALAIYKVSGVRVHRQGIGPRVFLVCERPVGHEMLRCLTLCLPRDAHPPEAEELAGVEKASGNLWPPDCHPTVMTVIKLRDLLNVQTCRRSKNVIGAGATCRTCSCFGSLHCLLFDL